MTELRRCRWCRRALPERTGRGRPREFCSSRCRQWDWVSRQRARELELSDGELVIAKATLDELHDELYVLACAVDDVERDLAAAGAELTAADLRQALDWLLDAARPLRDREIAAPVPHPQFRHDGINRRAAPARSDADAAGRRAARRAVDRPPTLAGLRRAGRPWRSSGRAAQRGHVDPRRTAGPPRRNAHNHRYVTLRRTGPAVGGACLTCGDARDASAAPGASGAPSARSSTRPKPLAQLQGGPAR